ncbi:trypsin-like peptidase domain-containing protein [Candidatus Parcubacteria bacterium]|nr:trypsin-like peptidase domain-containing protein [Candidatus Parcubacteria bacterium]
MNRSTFLTVIATSAITAIVVSSLFIASGLKPAAGPSLQLPGRSNVSAQQPDAAPVPTPIAKSTEEEIAEVVKRASPAVVSVIISKDLPVLEQTFVNPFEGFGDLFPEIQIPEVRQRGTQKQQIGAGSGFIVSKDGLVITNKHVVADTVAEYTVLLNDQRRLPAKVLARDPVQDVAILKIEGSNFPTLILGDSDKLEIGRTVIAIGNALGEFQNTVSVGVVSGLRRAITASGGGVSEQLENLIQTDAAINQGNSGGPLLNLDGEVVGVNTATVIGAQSIGFAIPAQLVKKDLADVKTLGKISVPFLGVRHTLVTKEVADRLKLGVDFGALITTGDNNEPAITPGSPAEAAGLKGGDVILELDGARITPANSLARLIQQHRVGDEVEVKVRRGSAEFTVKAKLVERPQG